MTTTATRRKRLTLDEQAALLQTGEEYRVAYQHMQVMAGGWLVVALLLLALLVGQASTTARAHMVYTGFGWQRPPVVVSNLSRATVRTAYVARRIAPTGWAGAYARTAYQCMQQPRCSAAYPAAWLWWWSALPDTRTIRTGIEWLAGLLALLTPSALTSIVDVTGWRRWEQRYVAQQHRAEQRRRRSK